MKIVLMVAIMGLFFVSVAIPVHAEIRTLDLVKPILDNDDELKFVGTVTSESKTAVYVVIRGPDNNNNRVGLFSDPFSDDDGSFETTQNDKVRDVFKRGSGIYNATGFSESQTVLQGITLQLEYDRNTLTVLPDSIRLENILDKTILERETLSFTASITDSSLSGLTYSLDGEPPGSFIDSSTGQFSWTPSSSQGSTDGQSYTFDVIVQKGSLRAIESVTVTVTEPIKEPPVPKPDPKPDPVKEPEPIRAPEPLGIAPFVDKTKDPQSYIDRYNNEPEYKRWFDTNYPEYSSIYEAVGLVEPPTPPSFVDPSIDPQHYIDRYNNEPEYKRWFDTNYPDMTIYQAVGVPEPIVVEPILGECGIGTQPVDGVCEIIEQKPEGGGCLIATAAYGTELAPQVQLLREIRDNTLLSTESGTSFMSGFNSLYYSFSPAVADLERENPVLREVMQVALTPMLSTLSIMSYAEEGSEVSVLALGISVIMLNLGMYIAAPVIGFKTGLLLYRKKYTSLS